MLCVYVCVRCAYLAWSVLPPPPHAPSVSTGVWRVHGASSCCKQLKVLAKSAKQQELGLITSFVSCNNFKMLSILFWLQQRKRCSWFQHLVAAFALAAKVPVLFAAVRCLSVWQANFFVATVLRPLMLFFIVRVMTGLCPQQQFFKKQSQEGPNEAAP